MKLKRVILTLILLIFVSRGVLATSQNIKITINGTNLHTHVSPKAINNRTMVPMRAIFEAMGAKVEWENGTQTATGTKANDKIKLQIGNPKATINGKEVTLDSPGIIVNGSTLVPVRFIAESLGSDVIWDSKNRTVIINNKDSESIDYKINYVTLNGVKISIGDTLDKVEKLLGKADRIDPSFFNYKWHVYNNDYRNFIMVGIGNGVVEAIYTNSKGFEVNGINYGDIISDKNGKLTEEAEKKSTQNANQSIRFDLDKFENNKVHSCIILPKGQQKEPEHNYELIRAQELENFDATNAFRVNHGKNPLKIDEKASMTAKKHSQDMADRNYFAHTSLDGLSPWDRYKNNGGNFKGSGENISAGRSSGIDAFSGWINSEGHRKNILNTHDYLGVGLGYNESSHYKYYMTQLFSRE